ncbi:LysR family transcriptional regulator [Pontivivens ytuae]|uniref:LysR family transcriptional regulator n=1 Tax=Pontivivens ytuae TaxID=2789856 RepID=A0A7S9LQ34_9RHOB|nr:LysR family transcriptional regulator [Pontivivens ytuae]QPH52665.1 LysR family transcriptional regulator [Pontivivens ytuae]
MSGRLEDSALFARVVELGSLRAAALEAGVEPSSISRRMTALETRLGAKLLDRSGARTRPTEAGQRYHAAMRGLMGQIEAVESEISGETLRPSGRLRVAASIDFGQAHVAPWLLDFAREHPEVTPELLLDSRSVDLVRDDIDVAVRVARPPDSALMARKLADVPRALFAAPSWLEKNPIETVADLAHKTQVFFHPEHRLRPLEITDPDGKLHRLPRGPGVSINAIASIVEAVKAGFGLTAGPLWSFHSALEAGEVVQVLPDHTLPVPPLMALWRPAVVQPAVIRAFVTHIAARAREVPGLTR